jgi:lysyl-tRNA synthetase class 2
MDNENQLIQNRIQKLNELEDQGINPYPYKWDKKNEISKIREQFSDIENDQLTDYTAQIAGRLISKRRQGKAGFANIRDFSDKIQLYFRQDRLGEENYTLFKKTDIGDFIGIIGKIFKTRTGEITVLVEKMTILSKSIRPLPEKWHGLQDIELRYRKRYLDLISNSDTMDIFVKRTKIIKAIREFLDKKRFIEVETPILQIIPGGADAKPFVTHHNALDIDLYMRIAPELYLKRLIIGGFERVYELNRNFRNEGMDREHNPEFTMLETYAAYWDYNDVMDFVEDMIKYIIDNIFNGSLTVERSDNKFDFTFPFKRLSMVDTINKKLGKNITTMSESELINEVVKVGKEKPVSKGKAIEKLFEHYVEPDLFEPVFVIDFPKESSPLTKDHREIKGFVERFELYIGGMEIANAYSELNNPIEQKKRFLMQEKFREKGDDEAQRMDSDFVEALEYGMPPTGGLGVGIDRLIMLLTNQKSIRDVILFPTMKKEAK